MRFNHPAWSFAAVVPFFVLACANGEVTTQANADAAMGDASEFHLDVSVSGLKFDGRAGSTRLGSDAPPGPNCGNGELTQDEACDDGNTLDGDGCAGNCLSVEPGFSCVTPGKPCRPVARCGDGLLVFPEQCDDGNKESGDGCSDQCKIEIGYKCDTPGQPCTHTTCGDGKIEGAESCEDGNSLPFDGCSADCTNEPSCKGTSGCTSRCGDGIKLSNEACDDGNNIDGDGCSADCKVEPGFTCEQPSLGDKMLVPAIYRDFRFHNPTDFEAGVTGSDTGSVGIVKPDLDSDGKPVFTGLTGNAIHIESADSFSKWYRNVDGLNHASAGKLTLWNNGAGAYVNRYKDDGTQWYNTEIAYYCGKPGEEATDSSGNPIPCTSKWGSTDCDTKTAAGEQMVPGSCTTANGQYTANFIVSKMDGNPLFFPVDGDTFSPPSEATEAQIPPYYDVTKRWPKESEITGTVVKHNFSFTSEVRYWFKYESGKSYVLDFVGDDDVWVFINTKLAVDLGGIHTPIEGSITIDATSASQFGIKDGSVYEIVVFQAERQTTGSSYKLTLSGFNAAPSICHPICGDGVLEIGEECDDGPDNGKGGYGSCSASCTLLAGFCGDGVIQPGEDCDDGGLNGIDANHCPSGCRYLIPIL